MKPESWIPLRHWPARFRVRQRPCARRSPVLPRSISQDLRWIEVAGQGSAICLARLPKGKPARRNSALRKPRSGARSRERAALSAPTRLQGGTAMHLLQQCASAYPPPAKCISDSCWPPVQNQPCTRASSPVPVYTCARALLRVRVTRADQHLAETLADRENVSANGICRIRSEVEERGERVCGKRESACLGWSRRWWKIREINNRVTIFERVCRTYAIEIGSFLGADNERFPLIRFFCRR